MHEQRLTSLPSGLTLDLSEAIPSQIVCSSEQVVWNNLTIRVYHHQPHTRIIIPPIAEDVLAVNLCGLTSLCGKVVRRFQNECWEVGNLVTFPKGEPVDLQWSAANEVLVFFPSPALLATLAADVLDIDPGRVELAERINTHDPLIHQIGRALCSELQAGGPMGHLYVEALTHTLAIHLLRNHVVIPSNLSGYRDGLAPASLRRVLDYILAHLAEDLTLEQIAQEAHLSPYHFARRFKQSIGQSVHQYVIEQRLEAAKRLLLTGQLSIGEIALQVGFHDQSHLHRHFKRRYQVTPRTILEQRTNVQHGRTSIQDSSQLLVVR